MELPLSTRWTVGILALVAYVVVVRLLRYRRRDAVDRKFPTRESFASMTLDDAFEIQSGLADLEFPTAVSASFFFALFKTYGVPSMSGLLVQTGLLAREKTASKRASDTEVLMGEATINHPKTPRAMDALARVNYIHDVYRRAGKIQDDDMTYTLSLLCLDCIRWIDRFEYRRLSDAERCAVAVYWRYMGQAMDIPFDVLPSSQAGWKDALHWLDELETWSLDYENKYMVPGKSNRVVVQRTFKVLFLNMPKFVQKIAPVAASYMLDPIPRRGMMLDEPSLFATKAMDVFTSLRIFVVRYLSLPRLEYFVKEPLQLQPNPDGRYHRLSWLAHPWYVKPTVAVRWSVKSFITRMMGGAIPGDNGDFYCPQGYLLSEVGPDILKGKGLKDMEATKERLMQTPTGTCPFSQW